MRVSVRRPVVRFGLGVATVVLVAAGCGSSGHSSAPPVAPSSSSVAPAAGSGGSTVTVGETEFHLALSTTTFSPGAYTFTAVNNGTIQHALEITGPGVDAQTSTLNPGESASLHVTLKAGDYDVFCPIGSHKALGMNAEITVGG